MMMEIHLIEANERVVDDVDDGESNYKMTLQNAWKVWIPPTR